MVVLETLALHITDMEVVEVDLEVESLLQYAMGHSQTMDLSHLLEDQLDLVEDLDHLLELVEY